MGHRANLVIVENGDYTLYYSHWCANRLEQHLFWGPEPALQFMRMQDQVDRSRWLNTVWAEGGAVLDRDHHVLLFFGGEDVRYDIPLRRAFLDMMRRVWSGWEIRWAYEGIADIAEYAGHSRTDLIVERERFGLPSLKAPPAEWNWIDTAGSMRRTDGSIALYPLGGEVENYLAEGPRLVEQLGEAKGRDDLSLDDMMEFPCGGFHIDVAKRTVDFWGAKMPPRIAQEITTAWSDWKVHWHQDHFESQLELTAPYLTFPCRSEASLKERLRATLLADSNSSPVDWLRDIVKTKEDAGHDVEVNPSALHDERLEMSRATRERILAIALQAD